MIDFTRVKELYVNEQEVKEFKIAGHTAWKKNEYQRVEYIESTGTQHIVTDYKVKPNTRLEIGLTAENENHLNWNMMVGARTSYDAPDCFNIYSNRGLHLAYGIGGEYDDYYFSYPAPQRFDCILDRWIFSANGVTSTETGNLTNGVYNVYIFAVNQKNSVCENKAKMKLYYCRFYEGDTLVREFIPCYRIEDGVIGLYEKVNDVFYTNAGTGTFLKGKDITVYDNILDTWEDAHNIQFIEGNSNNIWYNTINKTLNGNAVINACIKEGKAVDVQDYNWELSFDYEVSSDNRYEIGVGDYNSYLGCSYDIATGAYPKGSCKLYENGQFVSRIEPMITMPHNPLQLQNCRIKAEYEVIRIYFNNELYVEAPNNIKAVNVMIHKWQDNMIIIKNARLSLWRLQI